MLRDKHSRHMVQRMVAAERGSEVMPGGGEGGGGDGWAPEVREPGGDGMEFREETEDGTSGDLAGLVGRLLAVGEEGCFRMVVGFL